MTSIAAGKRSILEYRGSQARIQENPLERRPPVTTNLIEMNKSSGRGYIRVLRPRLGIFQFSIKIVFLKNKNIILVLFIKHLLGFCLCIFRWV